MDESAGGWQPIAPSPIPFDERSPVPREMCSKDIGDILTQFQVAARFSLDAGFEVLEIHMAHGYLLHEFLSPLSNKRIGEFGGTFENRIRLPLRVAEAVRGVWPSRLPVFVRISCTDWVEGGWDLAQSVELCRKLKEVGIDLIDCSSGALVPYEKIPAGPGFQVPFAAAIRKEVGMPTGAVGLNTQPVQADQIVATGQADVVLMAREMLRQPYWLLQAAYVLRADILWPNQYQRAKPRQLYTTGLFSMRETAFPATAKHTGENEARRHCFHALSFYPSCFMSSEILRDASGSGFANLITIL